MAIPLSDTIASFTLERVGDEEFMAPNMAYYGPGRDVVFAGQVIGQAIVAATEVCDGKTVKTISTHFPRAGRVSAVTSFRVRRINDGGTFASVTVSAHQGDRLIGESLVLLHSDDADAVRHDEPDSKVGTPDDADPRPSSIEGYLTRVADGIDYLAAGDLGEPHMRVWARFEDAPAGLALHQALAAVVSVPFLVGVALRPHEGITVADAHTSLSTGVMSHTLTFHESIDLNDWHLFDQEAPYAGRGRSFGRGDVLDEFGHLVASFSQDGLLRALDAAAAATSGTVRL